MKPKSKLLIAALILATATGSVWAHRPRASVGVYFGPSFGPAFGPYWHPWLYPPPLVYPPQVVVVRPEAPPVYVEQTPAASPAPLPAPAPPPAAAQPAPQYWYYCASSQLYYPYAKTCAEEWQKVLPQPEK